MPPPPPSGAKRHFFLIKSDSVKKGLKRDLETLKRRGWESRIRNFGASSSYYKEETIPFFRARNSRKIPPQTEEVNDWGVTFLCPGLFTTQPFSPPGVNRRAHEDPFKCVWERCNKLSFFHELKIVNLPNRTEFYTRRLYARLYASSDVNPPITIFLHA